MARFRSRTLVLLVGLAGVAALLATPARAAGKDASPEGDGIRIVTPADKTQLPVAGNGTVLVELHDRLETSSLHVVLSNPTAGRMVDLTARLVKGEHSATASFGPADLAQGITRVTATASREHGHTVRRAVSEFSWEPGIDTTAADRCELLGQDRCLLPFPRALIIRPARNLNEGGRYIVALRRLKDAGGTTIGPSRDFQVYRDHITTFIPAIEARRPHLEQLFDELGNADVGRSDLTLAWDFTVASERSLSERVLHIRDDAFASLHGGVPSFTVDTVERDVDSNILRRVTGTFQVPTYLTGTGQPGSRYNYGPDGLPA